MAKDPKDKIDLTLTQGAALDAALDNTTDAEIEASIRWLDEIAQEEDDTKEHPNGRQPQ